MEHIFHLLGPLGVHLREQSTPSCFPYKNKGGSAFEDRVGPGTVLRRSLAEFAAWGLITAAGQSPHCGTTSSSRLPRWALPRVHTQVPGFMTIQKIDLLRRFSSVALSDINVI